MGALAVIFVYMYLLSLSRTRIMYHFDRLNGTVLSDHDNRQSKIEDLLTMVRKLSATKYKPGRYSQVLSEV